jgi:hypothetical protein
VQTRKIEFGCGRNLARIQRARRSELCGEWGRAREAAKTGEVRCDTTGRNTSGSRSEKRYGETRAYVQRPLEYLADHANVGGVQLASVIGYQAIAVSGLATLAVNRNRRHLRRKRTYILLEQMGGGEPT